MRFFITAACLFALGQGYQPTALTSRRTFTKASAASFILTPTLASGADSSLKEQKYTRPPGSENAAVSAAFQAQADLTNERLRKSGFKLDTEAESSARLSSALSSFSYESATVSKKGGVAGKKK
ncbi:hypothetical protein TrRE_jg3989 [Triparma retinervis]|uniref:Uncharacterized protein n=1 Tax=Triparma retinervis TaxID=2557542 RepID=A0A9W7CDB5_9STRA|nr:hypothetical protein TrRE_jg3989 [Triparma retinervis]